MHFTALTADDGFPCPPTPSIPIPVNGGSGSGNGGGTGGGGTGGGGTGGGGGTTPFNPNGNGNPYNQNLVDYLTLSLTIRYTPPGKDPADEDYDDEDGGEEWFLVSRSPRYFSIPPFSDNTNPCGGGEDVGILLPPPSISDADLCNELKAKSQDPNFTAKMAELKAKAASQNFESAYPIYQNRYDGLTFGNLVSGTPAIPEVKLDVNFSATQSRSNCIGFMHCHLDNGKTFKTFSYSDIVALAKLDSLSTRPVKELAIYLTTASGTFAIKTNNSIPMQTKLTNLTKEQIGLNETIFRTYVKMTDNVDKQTINFLKFLKNRNYPEINLYEQDNTGQWKKLELNSLGTGLIKTNC
jgi:hypothetical protein